MIKLLKNRAIRLVFFSLLFVILFPLVLKAQENFKIEQLTSNDGLSHNSVRNVFQDSKGFIWIGTEGGLNKYDGYNITEYVNNPEPHLHYES